MDCPHCHKEIDMRLVKSKPDKPDKPKNKPTPASRKKPPQSGSSLASYSNKESIREEHNKRQEKRREKMEHISRNNVR